MAVIVVFNPELIEEQLEGINNNILKCRDELHKLKNSLELRNQGIIKKGKKPTAVSVEKRIAGILSPEHMDEIFTVEKRKGRYCKRICRIMQEVRHQTWTLLQQFLQCFFECGQPG